MEVNKARFEITTLTKKNGLKVGLNFPFDYYSFVYIQTRYNRQYASV